MRVDLQAIKSAAGKIYNLADELATDENGRFDAIVDVTSSLVSVQSFLSQLQAILNGEHGLITLLDWHKAESDVVSASLNDLAGVVSTQDADLSEALDGFYRAQGAEQHHSPFYVPEITSLGKGFKTKDGRRFHTLTGHGIPLMDEPLGRDAETLATEFAQAPLDLLYDVRVFAHKQAKIVDTVSLEIHKVAEEVKNSGSSDAFTYEAGLGIHRWADSMGELSKGFSEISNRSRVFASTAAESQAQFEEICSERKTAQSQDHATFSEAKFIEKANKVIAGSYNPGIHGADTKSVEFAMPMRAVRPEEIPFPGEPGFPGGSGSGFGSGGGSGIGGAGVGGGSLPQTPDFRGAPAPDATLKPQAPVEPGPGKIDIPDKPDPSLSKPTLNPDPTPKTSTTPTAPGQGVGGYTPPAGTKAATFTPTPTTPTTPGMPGAGAGTIPTPGRGGFAGQTPGTLRAPNGTPIPSPGPAPFWQGGSSNTGGGAGGSGGPRLAPGSPKTPGTATPRPGTPGAAGNAGAARGGAAGMRGMGMMGAPGAGGAGGKKGGKGFKRSRRSAKNTRKILRLDEQEQTLYGVIRHPKDPLFGTGR